jgi:hypothetical protein
MDPERVPARMKELPMQTDWTCRAGSRATPGAASVRLYSKCLSMMLLLPISHRMILPSAPPDAKMVEPGAANRE